MKKLLGLLGSLTLVASAGLAVVACDNGNEDTDENSVFIDGDGNLAIDSEKLWEWYNSHHGLTGEDANKFIKEFNSYAAAVFMESITKDKTNGFKKWKEQIITTAGNGNYMNDTFFEDIANAFGSRSDDKNAPTLWGQANRAYEDLAKEQEGNLTKYLKDKFPGVKDKDDNLKNAFLSDYVLNNPDNNAFKLLTDKIAFNASNTFFDNGSAFKVAAITDQNKTIITNFIDTYRDELNSENAMNAVKTKYNVALEDPLNNKNTILAVVDLANAMGGLVDDNLNEINYITTEEMARSLATENTFNTNFWNKFTVDNNDLYFKPVAVENFLNWKSDTPSRWDEIVNVVPDLEITENTWLKQDTSSGTTGIIKNSQRLLVDNYFKTKKPVAVSDVVFKPADGGTLDLTKSISINDFIPSSPTQSTLNEQYKGFAKFLNQYVAGSTIDKNTNLTTFDTIFKGTEKGKIYKDLKTGTSPWDAAYYATNNTKNLLTVDSTEYSDIAKYSIYDFILNGDSETSGQANSYTNTLNSKEVNNTDSTGGFDPSTGNVEEKGLDIDKINLWLDGDAKTGAQHLSEIVGELIGKKGGTKTDEAAKKPYVVFPNGANEQIIIYFDSEGLHFTKIEGYEYLKAPIEPQTKNSWIDGADKLHKQTLVAQSLTSLASDEKGKNIIPFIGNVSKLSSSPESKDEPESPESPFIPNSKNRDYSEKIRKYKINIWDLNSSISNTYEQWLVNNSVIKSLSTGSEIQPFYNFNILDDVKNSLTSTEEKPNLGSWMWTFFLSITGLSVDELIKQFFSEDSQLAVLTELVSEQIKIENISPNYNFREKQNKWIKDTEINKENREVELALEGDEKVSAWKPFIPSRTISIDAFASTLWNEKIFDPFNVSNASKASIFYKLNPQYLEQLLNKGGQ